MEREAARVRQVLRELLGADPVQLLRDGRDKTGIVAASRDAVRATIENWPVCADEIDATARSIERLANQIDRAADWVARGPDAIAMLTEQRRELELAALSLNVGPLRCAVGLRAFGDGPRFIQQPVELADRLEHLLAVLEQRLDTLDREPVIVDRSFPPEYEPRDGQVFATLPCRGQVLQLRVAGQWEPTDHTLMHLRVGAIDAGGSGAAVMAGRLRTSGPDASDLELANTDAEQILDEALLAADVAAPHHLLLVDQLVVAEAFAGQRLAPQLLRATADLALEPNTLVIVLARPRANRLSPERRLRLEAYARDAGLVAVGAGRAWVLRRAPTTE